MGDIQLDVIYKPRYAELQINMYVCCGEGARFSAEQLDVIPETYDSETADTVDVEYVLDEDTAWGAKEIVSICIAVLLVIGICVGIGFWKRAQVKAYWVNRQQLEKGVHVRDTSTMEEVDTTAVTTGGDVEMGV